MNPHRARSAACFRSLIGPLVALAASLPIGGVRAFDVREFTYSATGIGDRDTDPDCGDGGAPTGIGKPVSPFSGKEFLEHLDLEVPGVLPIMLVRRYDSASSYQSALGYGWSFTYDWRLTEFADGSVVVRNACGVRHRYVRTGNAFATDDTPGFPFDLREGPSGGYVLSDRPGTLRFFDDEGRLTAIQTPQGNRLEFEYDMRGRLPLVGLSSFAVEGSPPTILAYSHRLKVIKEVTADGRVSGRHVQFSYDEDTGRLLFVEAHDGRRIDYEQEMIDTGSTSLPTGNLTKVIGLEGIEQVYAYESPNGPHLLTSVQDGQGMVPVVNVYDSSGRVVLQTHGDRVHRFVYEPTALDFDAASDAADCDVRACRVVARTILAAGRENRTARTALKYRDDGYPVEMIDAEGNSFVYAYEPSRPYQTRVQTFRNTGTTASPIRLLQATVDRAYDLSGNLERLSVTLDATSAGPAETITRTWSYEDNWVASAQVESSAQPGRLYRTEWTFERAGLAPSDPGFHSNAPISNIHSMRRRRDDGSYDELRLDYNENGQLAVAVPPITSPDDGFRILRTYTTDLDAGLSGLLKEIRLEAYGESIDTLRATATYDARSFLATSTDAQGVTTAYEFDDLNRMTSRTFQVDADEAGTGTRFESLQYAYRAPWAGLVDATPALPGRYLAEVRRGSVTSAEWHVTRLLHDSRGRLIQVARVDDFGRPDEFMRFVYDSDDNVVEERDGASRVRTFFYDEIRRMVRSSDILGNATEYAYDARGNLTQRIDAKHRATFYTYDDLDRLIQVEEVSEGLTTRIDYDAVGNPVRVEDPKGQATAYEYDVRSRLLSVTDPIGVSTASNPDDFLVRHLYDDRDRLQRTINARGQVLDYSYLPWGGLDHVDHYARVGDADEGEDRLRRVSYKYDTRALMRSASDTDLATSVPAGGDPALEPAGRLYTFSYDGIERSRMTTAHFIPGGPNGSGRTLEVGFDSFGNRNRLTLSGVGEVRQYTWTFDARDRIVAACMPQEQPCSPAAEPIRFGYLGDSDDLEVLVHGNGVSTTRGYMPHGPVDSISVVGVDSVELQALKHDYDSTINVRSIRKWIGGVEQAPPVEYGYDGVDRLVRAVYPSDSGLPAREDFVYDAGSNRDDADGFGQALSRYAYDDNNRILSSGESAFAFDDDGNVKQVVGPQGTSNLKFDVENRLRNYQTDAGMNASYHYDPFGRRIRKEVGGVVTWYLWDEDQLLAEYDGAGVRQVRYAYALGFSPIEVAYADGGGGESIYSVHVDHIDTPMLLTDVAGVPAWRASHAAYGISVVDADPDGDGQAVAFNIRFPGQYFDGETKFYYNRFRYFDPSIGRYLSADPLGQLDSANLYQYALNRPATLTDPSGAAVLVGCLGGAAFSIAVDLARNAASGNGLKCVDLFDLGVGAGGACAAGAFGLLAGQRARRLFSERGAARALNEKIAALRSSKKYRNSRQLRKQSRKALKKAERVLRDLGLTAIAAEARYVVREVSPEQFSAEDVFGQSGVDLAVSTEDFINGLIDAASRSTGISIPRLPSSRCDCKE